MLKRIVMNTIVYDSRIDEKLSVSIANYDEKKEKEEKEKEETHDDGCGTINCSIGAD